MKSKRILALIAACTMLASMAGCGDSSSNTDSSKTESSSSASSSTADSSKSDSSKSDSSAADESTPDIEGYKLLWSDEFNGDKLDDSIWSYDPHEPGWTNNELQEYTESTDNVFVKDGKLTLKAIKTQKNGSDYYTSGKIKNQNKKFFSF